MDPFAALSVAVNIIDLVDKAIKVVTTVAQVYKSTDGLSEKSRAINREAGSLEDIVVNLRKCHSNAPQNDASQKMLEISITIQLRCIELKKFIDRFRLSNERNMLAVVRTAFNMLIKSGEIEQLQSAIASSRMDLLHWIAASTKFAAFYAFIDQLSTWAMLIRSLLVLMSMLFCTGLRRLLSRTVTFEIL